MDLDRRCRDVAQHCLAFNLRKATRLVTQAYDAALKPSGLRITQFSVLVAINLAQPVSMHSLAERLGMERTTLTRNLGSLEDAGLARSEPGEDRRSRIVSLTEEGAAALRRALPWWEKAQASAVEALGGEPIPTLMPILNRMSEVSRAAIAVEGAE